MLRRGCVKDGADGMGSELPTVPLTLWLSSGLGTETLETVKCGTEMAPVSTWEDISVVL